MLPALTLVILGQTYIFGNSPNTTLGGTNGIFIPGITQPPQQNLTKREDYTYTPGIGAHKVHTAATSWIKAVKTCRDEGAYLAVTNTPAEANVIAQLIAAAGPPVGAYDPNNFWIGIHDLVSQEGNWETIFGDSLAEAGFDEWHEEKSVAGAHCGAVYTDGRYSWLSCTRDLAFICELPNHQSCAFGNGAATQETTWWIRESLRKVLAHQ